MKIFKCLDNAKGMTLVESMVAILMILIVSIGATSIFIGTSKTSNLSRQQIETNQIIRIVKENVTCSIKESNKLIGNVDVYINPDHEQTNLKVVDLLGHEYLLYTFDIQFGGMVHNVEQYQIVLKRDHIIVGRFNIEVYSSL